MIRFSELELKEKEGCVSSTAPGPGRDRERERELAESQHGAGDWERSQPSSRPSAALSVLSDHTEQHNGKMRSNAYTQARLPLLNSFSFLSRALLCTVCDVRHLTFISMAWSFLLSCLLQSSTCMPFSLQPPAHFLSVSLGTAPALRHSMQQR